MTLRDIIWGVDRVELLALRKHVVRAAKQFSSNSLTTLFCAEKTSLKISYALISSSPDNLRTKGFPPPFSMISGIRSLTSFPIAKPFWSSQKASAKMPEPTADTMTTGVGATVSKLCGRLIACKLGSIPHCAILYIGLGPRGRRGDSI
jgi:hypothetical protein